MPQWQQQVSGGTGQSEGSNYLRLHLFIYTACEHFHQPQLTNCCWRIWWLGEITFQSRLKNSIKFAAMVMCAAVYNGAWKNDVLCLIKSNRSGVNVSTSEVKLAMAYIMFGLHGETAGSIRPITSATFVRRVLVAVAVIANTLTSAGRRLLISPTRRRTLRKVSPLNHNRLCNTVPMSKH